MNQRIFVFSLMLAFLTAGTGINAYAQDGDAAADADTNISADADTTAPDTAADNKAEDDPATMEEVGGETDVAVDEDPTFHQILKRYYIEGDPKFMTPVLLALILGLALCIERIIYLNMATTNSDKLLSEIEGALGSGGVEAAKEVCRNTKGPVASIFYQGLMRSDEGIDVIEKSIISYGGVQMGLLEKGLSWIQLFIALAPMLGFMGTVIGMIGAFDAIEEAGDISPSLVAGGIKVALLTTVFGLVVAIILQLFYNYIVSKVDDIVNSMEESSITLVDILSANKIGK
ncbi:MAG: MotA/TolQ/ExbB proton channel family protein [Bacteroidetes bacterium]|nr:MotA/TolQ/ExbB proton channel family protein [Bacteroidota bacterium]